MWRALGRSRPSQPWRSGSVPAGADAVIQHVLSGGAGESAGLAPGDLVVAVDGLRVTAENLERLVPRRDRPGPVALLSSR